MPDNYFARYLPLLIHSGVAFAVGGGMIVLSQLVGRHRYTRAKFQPYECGMTPVGDARARFSVKFYLVAMLFILFDVEAVFLYPWAILLKELKMFGFFEMLTYIAVLLVGFFYVWKKGILDWAETRKRVDGKTVLGSPDQRAARLPSISKELLAAGGDKS